MCSSISGAARMLRKEPLRLWQQQEYCAHFRDVSMRIHCHHIHCSNAFCCVQGWPLPGRTKVWVCSSTSGAAPMTSEERLGPWQQLSDALKDVPWPPVAQCSRDSVKD